MEITPGTQIGSDGRRYATGTQPTDHRTTTPIAVEIVGDDALADGDAPLWDADSGTWGHGPAGSGGGGGGGEGTVTSVNGVDPVDGDVTITAADIADFDTAAAAAASALAIVTKTADYVLALTEAGKLVELNEASAVTLTVPPHATVAFPVGTSIDIAQLGAGTGTVAAGVGVTIHSRGALTSLAGQYAVATLIQRAVDVWYLAGDLA